MGEFYKQLESGGPFTAWDRFRASQRAAAQRGLFTVVVADTIEEGVEAVRAAGFDARIIDSVDICGCPSLMRAIDYERQVSGGRKIYGAAMVIPQSGLERRLAEDAAAEEAGQVREAWRVIRGRAALRGGEVVILE